MEYKRVVVYLDEEDHRYVKSRLALSGLDFSRWVRECIRGAMDEWAGGPITEERPRAKRATIDGVQCEEGTRVRVRLGPKAKQNGVWIAKAGKWTEDKGGKAKRGGK